MKRKFAILIAAAFFSVAAIAQTDSVIHVKAFPGVTVGQKVSAAMQTCQGAPVPCYIVIDSTLAATPAGTIPAMCSNCELIDYRSGWPGGGGNPGGDGITNASAFGVVGDEIDNRDGTMAAASATLTATSSPFTSRMVGHPIDVYGAGASVTPTLTLTAGSVSATVSSGSGISLGMLVVAAGVPAATFVLDISGSALTLTQPATANESAESSVIASPFDYVD